MFLAPVLAQAAQPVVIDNGISFALPIVILLIGLAAALAESRLRVSQLEKRVEKLDERQSSLEKDHGDDRRKLDTTMAILGRVEKGVDAIRQEISDAFRKSA